jgi:hypothetical protein
MPFNSGGQTYIGGQLLASGLSNLGKGIGSAVEDVRNKIDEQRKMEAYNEQRLRASILRACQAFDTERQRCVELLEQFRRNYLKQVVPLAAVVQSFFRSPREGTATNISLRLAEPIAILFTLLLIPR